MVLRLLASLFFISAFFGIYHLQNKIAPVNFKIEKRKTFYLPTTEACKVISLGFYEMYADILWIRATQFYAEKLFDPLNPLGKEEQDFWYLRIVRAIDIVTDLDPHYRDVYDVGKPLLFALKSDNDSPLQILKKGYFHNKKDWHYAYDLGVGYYIELRTVYERYIRLQEQGRFRPGDPRANVDWNQKVKEAKKEGAYWFKLALEHQDLPKELRDIIPRFFLAEGENFEEVLAIWIYKLEESERFNEKQVSNYIQEQIFELVHLHQFRKLFDACVQYQKNYRVYPESLEQVSAFVPSDFPWKQLHKKNHKEFIFYDFSFSKKIQGHKKEFLIEFEDTFFIDPVEKKLRSQRLISPFINGAKREIQKFSDEYFQQHQKRVPREELEKKRKEFFWVHPVPWKDFEVNPKGEVVEVFR